MNFSIYKGLGLAFLIFYSMNIFSQPGSTSFNALWAKVDSLEQKGLTRSALKEIASIKSLAEKEEEPLQHVKALLYQLKYESVIEEQSEQTGAFTLEKAAAEAAFPQKQILSSYLAWYYWQYYQNYRYQILERSALQVTPEDFQTWDAKQFHQKISGLFLQSLEQAEQLQKEAIEGYNMLLIREKGSEKFRPTLYDVLGHQALNYFSHEESRITQAQELFSLSTDQALVDAEQFVKEEFVSPDSLAPLFLATRLYQDLLSFHLNRTQDDLYALIDLDLARLNFVSQSAKGSSTQSGYRECLRGLLEEANTQHPALARVHHALATSYVSSGNSYDPLKNTVNQWDLKEAHKLCSEAIERYPDSPGATLCQNLLNQIESKQLNIELEEVILPSQPSLVKISYKNLTKLYFKVVGAPDRRGGGYDRDRMINLLNGKKVIKSWEVVIPEGDYSGDFQTHSSEVMMEALPVGDYVLMVSDSPEFSYKEHGISYAPFQISQLSYFSRTNPESGNLEVFVVDRENGQPLEKVAVQAYLWDYNSNKYRKSGSRRYTNSLGYVDIPARKDYQSFELELTLKTDRFRSSSLYAYSYGRNSRPEREQIHTHFFLDRKIFRPGQTLHFKGIVLSRIGKKHSIKKNHGVTVRLFDVNGEEVSSLELRSNDFGSISGSFPTPMDGLLGRMRIEGGGGSTDFSVEEYKRPSFEVSLDQPEGPLKLGDLAQVSGTARSYAGVSLADVEVRYRVVRRARFPYWWWGFRRPYPSSPEREVAAGTANSDALGAFSISFPLIPDEDIDPSTKPVFTYQVFVDVVDLTGETQSQSEMVQVGYDPFVLELDGPEELSNRNPGKLVIRCEKAPVASDSLRGTVEIFRLENPKKLFIDRKWERPDIYLLSKERFENNFPYLPYKEENESTNWPQIPFSSTQSFLLESSHTFSMDVFNGAKPGMYLLKVSALDGEVATQKMVKVFDPEADKPALPEVVHSRLSQERAEPGQEIVYSLQAEENKTWVFYELAQGGKILDSEFIRLKRNRKHEIPVRIEESHRGNLVLSATWVHNNRFDQATQTLVVPWTNKQLSLEWETFRSELEPGSGDTWRVTIKGPESDAVSSEMVATLYDASLDLFRPNSYGLSLYPTYYRQLPWNGRDGFSTQYGQLVSEDWNRRSESYSPQGFDRLNGFGFLNEYLFGRFGGIRRRDFSVRSAGLMMRESSVEMDAVAMSMDAAPVIAQSKAAPAPREEASGSAFEAGDAELNEQKGEAYSAEQAPALDFDQLEIRKDFRETAFFFPHLQTDDSGHVQLEFTMPEALTRWKFLGLAHTQDLKVGTISGEVVTKKKLMVKASLPRFLREGDVGTLSAKVSNMTEGIVGRFSRYPLAGCLNNGTGRSCL